MQKIVIIGAGQAGYSVASRLRKEKFDGSIKLIGDENEIPYQRPPLSKAYLLGKMEKSRLQLRKKDFYEKNDIELITGQTITCIDRTAYTVKTADSAISYDRLVIATGSEPRRFPSNAGGDIQNVYTIRNIQDVDALAAQIDQLKHVLVIGGGYIGLEAAAVLRQIGIQVTLIEAGPRILGRVASQETADYFRKLHQDNGVVVREGESITNLSEGINATFENGEQLSVDAVIVGIGASAVNALALDCGLDVDPSTGGITTDAYGTTSDTSIYAAGDCATFSFNATPTRLESVQNAIDQAENIALNLLGKKIPYQPTPWFWSDQYNIKLQIAGFNRGYDRVVVRPGKDSESVSHWYFQGQRLLAVDAINDAPAYICARKLLESGSTDAIVTDEALSDPGFDIKSLLN